jgi:hypothetical protein
LAFGSSIALLSAPYTALLIAKIMISHGCENSKAGSESSMSQSVQDTGQRTTFEVLQMSYIIYLFIDILDARSIRHNI